MQGEICVASSRLFVQEGIYEKLVEKLVEKAKAWVVGDPFDPKVQHGPQVWNEKKKKKMICLFGLVLQLTQGFWGPTTINRDYFTLKEWIRIDL